jgi:hypothetical protein
MKTFFTITISLLIGSLGCFAGGPLDDQRGLIRSKETAIRVAEAILFPIYGRKTIEAQKPYEVELHDGTWYVSAHTPKGYNGPTLMFGGGFYIALSQKDARVLEIGYDE